LAAGVGYTGTMVRIIPFALTFLAASVVAQPMMPKALADGFARGQWRIVDANATQSTGRQQCIGSAAELLTHGRPAAGCQFRILTDEPTKSVVTYRCEGGTNGRTEIRRDADGIYTVDAQGVEAGLPFAARTEWRRTGDC
jgi:hypothetical protein